MPLPTSGNIHAYGVEMWEGLWVLGKDYISTVWYDRKRYTSATSCAPSKWWFQFRFHWATKKDLAGRSNICQKDNCAKMLPPNNLSVWHWLFQFYDVVMLELSTARINKARASTLEQPAADELTGKL